MRLNLFFTFLRLQSNRHSRNGSKFRYAGMSQSSTAEREKKE